MVSSKIAEEDFRYNPLSPQELVDTVKEFEESFRKYKEVMNPWLSKYPDDIRINIPMIYRIIERIDQRRDYYLYFHSNHRHAMRMSQAKELSLFCYWFLKYKPLSFEEAYADAEFFVDNSYSLNEMYVAYALVSFIVGVDASNEKFFSDESLSTLTYSITNREISKEALILYVESFLTDALDLEGVNYDG